jgi:molybdenum cofactor synthesis domain-containing protein
MTHPLRFAAEIDAGTSSARPPRISFIVIQMSSSNNETTSVAGIIIGDELLSGKVKEDNSPFLIKELRRLGARLEALHILPDQIPVLARYLREASEEQDYVVTSGGLGPTHDDRTMNAVAEAFDVDLIQNDTYEETLRNVYGGDVDDHVLSMAKMPEGIEFEWGDMLDIPAARFRNVFILPGNPELFRSKFNAIQDVLRTNQQFYCHRLFLDMSESSITVLLETLQNDFPSVDVGSYPCPWNDEYQEMVTIESTSEYEVERASEALHDRIDPERIVREEEE